MASPDYRVAAASRSEDTRGSSLPATSKEETMKVHFESDLDYELAAIESVSALFRGQEICRTQFS